MTSVNESDEELAALHQAYAVIRPLSPDARERVLSYLDDRLRQPVQEDDGCGGGESMLPLPEEKKKKKERDDE